MKKSCKLSLASDDCFICSPGSLAPSSGLTLNLIIGTILITFVSHFILSADETNQQSIVVQDIKLTTGSNDKRLLVIAINQN